MKLHEDDIAHNTEKPEGEQPEGSEYYYDDSTGYELYEPTTSLEEDEPEGEEATGNGAECYRARNISSLRLILAVFFLGSFIGA